MPETLAFCNADLSAPVLHMFSVLAQCSPLVYTELLATISGPEILRHFFSHSDAWHSRDDSDSFERLVLFAKAYIGKGLVQELFDAVHGEDQYSPQQISLLKILDLAVSFETAAPELVRFFIRQYQRAADAATGLLDTPVAQWGIEQQDTAQVLTSVLLLLSEYLVRIGTQESLKTERRAVVVLSSAVYLLKVLHRAFPVNSKAKDGATESVDLPFALVKRDAIRIITVFSMGSKRAQDTVREHDGLLLVLAQCKIDPANPFIREHAILCIRHLLENNPESQNLVRSLEARTEVSADEMREWGLGLEVSQDGLLRKKAGAADEHEAQT
jgi:hypothetical protein